MSNKTPKHGEFCWNELMTNNTTKAKEFYTGLFGWSTEDHNFGQGNYTMLKLGETGIGGIMQIPQGQEKFIPPHWMSYINVNNIDNTVTKAKSLGGKVKMDVTQVGDFGRFAVIEDPTGAHIAFWESKSNK
jgi:predicted enzyme related to lactoylglutathione lyase